MSKRSKKDIQSISDEQAVSKPVLKDTDSISQSSNTLESGSPKRSRRSSKAKTALLEKEATSLEDLELEKLLLQVDHMLTEMTQSKWLSSDWPSLEIDFGPEKIKQK
ncbi:MAG: hypothetical protein K2X27_19780 [Candidatus Obscuribacterales bacterium]|nr:hypothetical protein [Candidatus Obscuribacterales bacterium]